MEYVKWENILLNHMFTVAIATLNWVDVVKYLGKINTECVVKWTFGKEISID